MKKRCVMFVLLLALLLLLTGCGQKKIGICLRQESPTYMAAQKRALKTQEYQITVKNANRDQAAQLGQIAELIEANCRLLVVEPVMIDATQEIADMGKIANIPVIFLNYQPPQQVLHSWDKLFFLGSDLSSPGRVQGELIASLPDAGDLNGDGIMSYGVLSGPADHIDASLWSSTCGVVGQTELLSIEEGDWSKESGRKNTAKLLTKHGKELEVLFCFSDEIAVGALEAIADAERMVGDDLYLVRIGGERGALLRVRSGEITGTVTPDYEQLAEMLSQMISACLSGEQAEKIRLLGFVPVTQENVDRFLEN